MNLSNERILRDAPVLRNISQKQLPVKVSYAIAKNINKIEAELKIYNQENQKLIDKYGEKDDKGELKSENGSIPLQKDQIDNFSKDYKELLAIENEIEIHKFKMSEFEGKTCEFSAAEFMAIDYMIEE